MIVVYNFFAKWGIPGLNKQLGQWFGSNEYSFNQEQCLYWYVVRCQNFWKQTIFCQKINMAFAQRGQQ